MNKLINGLLLAGLLVSGSYIWYLKGAPIPITAPSAPVKEKVRTVTQTVTKPGGETVVTQTIESQSVSNPLRKHKVGVGVQTPWNDLEGPKIYEINLYRRVFDNTWLGVGVTTDKAIKLSTQIEF